MFHNFLNDAAMINLDQEDAVVLKVKFIILPEDLKFNNSFENEKK